MLQKYHIFFKSILWIIGLSCIFLFFLGFSILNMINTLFLVSLFFFCIYCFKWILDQGTFYTFEYSWQKTKRYVLFFLPKYWPISNKKNDYDEKTGEKRTTKYLRKTKEIQGYCGENSKEREGKTEGA